MQYRRKTLIAIFILFSFVSVNTSVFGQGPNMERMKTQRIAFFTEKLDLSEREAQNFWPVYNEYSAQKEINNRQSRSLTRYVSENIDEMSEDEVNVSLKKYIAFEKKSHQLFIAYNEKFLEILPPKKVMKLYIAENQFKQYLLRQIGDQRKQRMQGRR